MQTRNRKRVQLILLASLFVVPMLLAAWLAGSGWIPDARSYGQGILPQRSVEAVKVLLEDGNALDWHDPDWRWSVVAIAHAPCATRCMEQLDRIHRARVSLNQNAKRVRLLYLGAPPVGAGADELMRYWQQGSDVDGGFAEWVPASADGVAVVLVKPDGTALTSYADGFNASGLRKDLAKVTK